MAIALMLGPSGVQNGAAVFLPPPGDPAGLNYTVSSDRLQKGTDLNLTQGAVLNSRYLVGGSGSWERPWGPV